MQQKLSLLAEPSAVALIHPAKAHSNSGMLVEAPLLPSYPTDALSLWDFQPVPSKEALSAYLT